MKNQIADPEEGKSTLQAEFDCLADEYYHQHATNISITGEGPEYFAEYKIADLARFIAKYGLPSSNIFDFGSGIGNSLPYFRTYFGDASLICGDVSARSLEIARKRFGGGENQLLIGTELALPDASQDVVFSACVFHHIPQESQIHWLTELLRITRPGGLLAIYEHNPLNPLTLRAVSTCPFDANAKLIRAEKMRQRVAQSGWTEERVDYRLFFPAWFKKLRAMEPHLSWCALGAQYRVVARCPR
jgi:SAM-dependent methyltransferase